MFFLTNLLLASSLRIPFYLAVCLSAFSDCLSACLSCMSAFSTCLLLCPSKCLLPCLSACLSACPDSSAYPPVLSLSVPSQTASSASLAWSCLLCLPVSHVCLTCLSVCLPPCLPASLSSYPTCLLCLLFSCLPPSLSSTVFPHFLYQRESPLSPCLSSLAICRLYLPPLPA